MSKVQTAGVAIKSPETKSLSDAMDLERMRVALMSAGDVVYDCLYETGEIAWGEGATAAFAAYGMEPCRTRDEFLTYVDDEGRREIDYATNHAVRTGDAFATEYRIKTELGTHAWVEDRASVIVDDHGQPVRTIGLLRFVTQRKEREERLLQLATFDDLTGHYNRSRLRSLLTSELEKYWNERRSGGFVIAGIDNLGMLNQNFGFDIADRVIVEVGKKLQQCLGPDDIMGRVSGNKFGVILADCREDALVRRVNTLKDAIRETVVYTQAGPVSVTTSMGVLSLPFGCKNSKEAFAFAEEALAHAKSYGGDKVYFFERSEKRETERKRKLAVADQVMSAIKDNRVSLYYQPIFRVGQEAPAFYECLIRITDPGGDVIPAGHFIPVAEELGLIRILDMKVVERALEALRAHPDINLAINVSGVTATDPSWFADAVERVRQNKDIASRLIVEITETVALQEIGELSNFLDALRQCGCRIAIDDFGAGYTSYRNLQSLDVDMVKIDGSFVKGITEAPDNQYFVKALIDLARNFELETVAEWIEEEAEVKLLEAFGVDYLQGFHLGKPGTEPVWPPKKS